MSGLALTSVPKTRPLQRKCACGAKMSKQHGACEKCRKENGFDLQRKASFVQAADSFENDADRAADHVLRHGRETDARAPLRIQRLPQGGAVRRESPSVVDDVLSTAGRPLDLSTRSFFERRFGHDFERVRVHDDVAADRSARGVGALAYTVGSHIVFAGGQYAPGLESGRRLLAHELTHVLQQDGNPAPSLQRKPGPTVPLGASAPFAGRILSAEELKRSRERSKAFRFTGQSAAKVCETPDPARARLCTVLEPGTNVRVVRVVMDPTLDAETGVWVEGGAGWYQVEREGLPGGKGYVLGVFVGPLIVAEEEEKEEPPGPKLPVPEQPKEPPGPKRPPPGGPALETFCKPYGSKGLALRAHATTKKGLMAWARRFGADVQDLWRTYIDTPKTGVKGALPARRLFGDQKSRVVKEFREEPATVNARNELFVKVLDLVRTQPDLVPPEGESTGFLPLRRILGDDDLLNLKMKFETDPMNRIPASIAGGFGKNSSDAGDDVRNVDGTFAVTNLGLPDIRLVVTFIFDIFDAIDFCPGAPGSLTAQLAVTDDLSRLEATPDVPTYDTPFEVIVGASDEKDAKL